MRAGVSVAVGVLAVAAAGSEARADLVLQLRASDYNASTGTLNAVVGPNASQASIAARPTLISGNQFGTTFNGTPSLRFDGNDFLDLSSSIATPGDLTAFAYVRPAPATAAGDPRTIMSGAAGSFQYRVGGDGVFERQQVIRTSQANLGSGLQPLDSAAFNSINVGVTFADATPSTTLTFRSNGADDGTATAGTAVHFGPLLRIGSSNNSEFYRGDIAEVRVYNTLLTTVERQQVETDLAVTYGQTSAPNNLITGGTFETPDLGSGFQYNPTQAGFTYLGQSGIAAEGSAFGVPNTPSGKQGAFLQTSGSQGRIRSAALSLSSGMFYTLGLAEADRGTQNNPYDIFLDSNANDVFDGADVLLADNHEALGNAFSNYIQSFTVPTTGTYNLVFLGQAATTADNTVFLDNVTLVGHAVPEPAALSLIALAAGGFVRRRARRGR